MGLFPKKKLEIPHSVCQTILIGGEAGQGIKSAGKICALSLIKHGYNVFVYDEYPSLIRGGHNMVSITCSRYPVYSHNSEVDILLCMDRTTFDKHKNNLSSSSIVIYDSNVFEILTEDIDIAQCEFIELPADRIISQNNLDRIVRNTLFLTTGLLVFGIEKKEVIEIVHSELKGSKILKDNLECIDYIYENFLDYFNIKNLNNSRDKEISIEEQGKASIGKYLMSGNDAAALGALKSGLGFYAAYPMTPASSILETLFSFSKEYNVVVKQAEDEIAAINMAIGASFAGVRSMVATSGGGFSLMVEGLGLAAITETPIVIILSQRPGPATGLPTWTGQGDLLFALNASQDEFPRVIFTPTDAEEVFNLTFAALNISEKYQLPSIILLDKYISESLYHFSFNNIKNLKIDRGLRLNERVLLRLDNFDRYELTPKGISAMTVPGQKGGIFLANSDEGDEKGYSNEDAQNRKNKVEKRFRKAELVVNDMPKINIFGDIKSNLGIICWGSTKGPVLEAIRRLQSIGEDCKLLALNFIEPFPKEQVEEFIKMSKKVILIENNFTSQLGKLILLNTDYEIDTKLLKYDGRPFSPKEIVEQILEFL